jgi:2-methylcitrate dehydratase PrpD
MNSSNKRINGQPKASPPSERPTIMPDTLVQQMAEFTSSIEYAQLPEEVVEESKRIILDSIGCALAGVDDVKGRIGIEYGLIAGGATGEATIFGTGHRSSVLGAGFANGELINALDFDSILPPGHVSPYVLPGAFAVGETLCSDGAAFLTAVATAHELSYRMGKAMNYLRDIRGGQLTPPAVSGYSSTIFGAVAAIGKLQGFRSDVLANALGIAAAISPVQPQQAWNRHVPSASIKYYAAGPLVQAAVAAAYMAELGHTGDIQVLDDREFGYAKFIGTDRWEPDRIVAGLGADWGFPAESAFKLYPHCRVMATPFDALTHLLTEHDIKPDEIDAIRVWGEAWVMQHPWIDTTVTRSIEAQFSMAHGVAVAAQRLTPGKGWQDPALIQSQAVLELMKRVTVQPHPDYVAALSEHPSARQTRVEVDARGTTFEVERRFPRGVATPDPGTSFSNEELIAKFLHNAEDVLPVSEAEAVVVAVMHLERVDDVSLVFRRLGTVRGGERAHAQVAGD